MTFPSQPDTFEHTSPQTLRRAILALTPDDRHDFSIHLGTNMHLGKHTPDEVIQTLSAETHSWDGDMALEEVLFIALDDAFPTILDPAKEAIVERLFRFSLRAHPLGEGLDEARADTIRRFDPLLAYVSRYQEVDDEPQPLRALRETLNQSGAQITTQDDENEILYDVLSVLADPAYATDAEALAAIEMGYVNGVGKTLTPGPRDHSVAWNADAIRLAIESLIVPDTETLGIR